MTERWDRLAVLGAAVAFGSTGTAKELGPDQATSLGVGTMRIVVGAAGLVAFSLVARSRRRCAPSRPLATAFTRPPLKVAVVAVLGGAGVALYQPAFFAGTHRCGVAVGTLVALGSGPAFVGLWELFARHRRPGRTWLMATGLAVVGGIILVLSQQSGGSRVDGVGVVCSLLAGLGYAVFATAAKALVDGGTDSNTVMAWLFVTGAIMLAPFLFTQPLGWLGEWKGALMVAHLGIVTTTVAYLLYGYGLRTLDTSTAVTLTLAEPVTAAIAGVVALDERLTLVGWLGAAVVLAGLAIIGRGSRGTPPLPA